MLVVEDDSRPSHITALRKARFVVGSGRRYTDTSLDAGAHWYGSATLSMKNSVLSGRSKPTRISPRVSSRLYACRCSAFDCGVAPSQFDPSLLAKIGSRPP